jgi:hypothetical protein
MTPCHLYIIAMIHQTHSHGSNSPRTLLVHNLWNIYLCAILLMWLNSHSMNGRNYAHTKVMLSQQSELNSCDQPTCK